MLICQRAIHEGSPFLVYSGTVMVLCPAVSIFLIYNCLLYNKIYYR